MFKTAEAAFQSGFIGRLGELQEGGSEAGQEKLASGDAGTQFGSPAFEKLASAFNLLDEGEGEAEKTAEAAEGQVTYDDLLAKLSGDGGQTKEAAEGGMLDKAKGFMKTKAGKAAAGTAVAGGGYLAYKAMRGKKKDD